MEEISKYKLEFDKLQYKQSISSKDAIKYLKSFNKMSDACVKHKLTRILVESDIVDNHFNTLYDSIYSLVLKKSEANVVKETRGSLLTILSQKTSKGIVSLKSQKDLKKLYQLILVLIIEDKDVNIFTIISNGLSLKLEEIKQELVNLIDQEICSFVEGFNSQKKQAKSELFRSVQSDDSKYMPYLTLPDQLSSAVVQKDPIKDQLQSKMHIHHPEIDSLINQVVKYFSVLSFVTRIKNIRSWKTNIDNRAPDDINNNSSPKVDHLDPLFTSCVKHLFNIGFNCLSNKENTVLRAICCLVFEETKWFWSDIESVGLEILEKDIKKLEPHEVVLISKTYKMMVNKLSKIYLCKSEDYNIVRSKLSNYLNREGVFYLNWIIELTLEDEMYKKEGISSSVIEDIFDCIDDMVLYLNTITCDKISESAINMLKRFSIKYATPEMWRMINLESLHLILKMVDFNKRDNSSNVKLATMVFYNVIIGWKDVIETEILAGYRIYVEILNTYNTVFAAHPLKFNIIIPIVFSIAHRTAVHILNRREKDTESQVRVIETCRNLYDVCMSSPSTSLVVHHYNRFSRFRDIAKNLEENTVDIIIQYLKLNRSYVAEGFDRLLVETCFFFRNLRDHNIINMIRRKVEESTMKDHISNLLHLNLVSNCLNLKVELRFGDQVSLSCFGINSLEILVKRKLKENGSIDKDDEVNLIKDEIQVNEFYRTNINKPSVQLVSFEDFFLTDNDTIIQVKRGELVARNERGAFTFRLLESPMVRPDNNKLINFLILNGWVPSVACMLNKNLANFDHALAMLDQEDTLVNCKIGLMVVPTAQEIKESFERNEDLEKLMVQKSEQELSTEVHQIISDMVCGDVLYKSPLPPTHLVRPTLIVANKYINQKNRLFELKKELGTCEVNIYIDEEGTGTRIKEQFIQSDLTFIEILASRLSDSYWMVSVRPQKMMMDKIGNQQHNVNGMGTKNMKKTMFKVTDFNSYWIAVEYKQPVKFITHRSELPTYLKGLSIYYSLLIKSFCSTLKDPIQLRKIKIAEVSNRYVDSNLTSPSMNPRSFITQRNQIQTKNPASFHMPNNMSNRSIEVSGNLIDTRESVRTTDTRDTHGFDKFIQSLINLRS